MKNVKRIVIFGADGFIGSNLSNRLAKESDVEITAFDLFRNGKARNILPAKNLKLFSGNFLNRDDVRRAVNGSDYVFHFISLTTPGSSMDEPLIDVETNIKGTIILLDECSKARVKKVIFSSSGGAIYGNQDKEKFSENDETNPISPYAISKLAIEKYLEYYRVHRGLEYLVLRYSNPYGPGQNILGSQGIIPIFLNLVKNDLPVMIFGDGENLRDYIYIDDLINLTIKLYTRKNKYRIYNIASGKSVSINNVISILKKVTKKEIRIKNLPNRDTDVKKVIIDISRVSREISCKETIGLEDGIKRTWNWINSMN